jgi:hypothetical protein
MRKFQLCLILDNTKDILPITGTKTNIISKDAKVSTLFDIGQHKRYFTDCLTQNKSSQKVGLAGGGADTIPHQY